MLAGDLIMQALKNRGQSKPFDLDSAPADLADFAQGGTDSGNIAEFLTFDIGFNVEPATGLIFPTEVDRG
jgi:hypothetical protein